MPDKRNLSKLASSIVTTSSTLPGSPCNSDLSQPDFSLPSESLIFFDWDDTLFPTTELFDVMGLRNPVDNENGEAFPPAFEKMLQDWRVALENHIERACSLSEHVVVVTNARSPWVETCLTNFAPALKPLFTRVKVVYAEDALAKSRKGRSIAGGAVGHVAYDSNRLKQGWPVSELIENCVQGKLAAMQREAKRFYSGAKGQPWKNIISMGDAQYERLACQELAWLSPPDTDDDKVRIKTFVVPGNPTVSELTLRLRMSTCLMPAWLRFDGDIDCDLDQAANPMQHIADTLEMPEIGLVRFPGHAFGRSERPELQDETAALSTLQLFAEIIENRSSRRSSVEW